MNQFFLWTYNVSICFYMFLYVLFAASLNSEVQTLPPIKLSYFMSRQPKCDEVCKLSVEYTVTEHMPHHVYYVLCYLPLLLHSVSCSWDTSYNSIGHPVDSERIISFKLCTDHLYVLLCKYDSNCERDIVVNFASTVNCSIEFSRGW